MSQYQPLTGTAADEIEIEIGRVLDVGGAAAEVMLDAGILALLAEGEGEGEGVPGTIGSHVKLRVGSRWVLAQLRTLRRAEANGDLILATMDFVGEATDDGGRLGPFRRGVTRLPMPGGRLHPASADDLARIYATHAADPHIDIGAVMPGGGIRAALRIDTLLGRHFAILGSTGTGKSSATALILHRICEAAPRGHILMIDPHGEYAAAFGDTGVVFDAANLAIPYWLLNLEEHAAVFVTTQGPERQGDIDLLGRCLLAARGRNRAAEGVGRLTVDTPIPYLLSDLGAVLQAELGKLDKASGMVSACLRLKARIDEVKGDPRYAFMFSGMLVADSMGEVLTRLLRLDGGGKPIAIVDLSGVPSEITAVVVALLARLTFDHAVWSRGGDQRPVLLICEEAHRYIPADGPSPARAVLERIAKEGRKYGVALGLVSQRPSDLAEGVLSQCGTIVAMRLNNERDQAHVRAAVPDGARGLVGTIPGLRNREAIVVGEGVSIPLRVAFATLPPGKLPASDDPVFTTSWAAPADDAARTARVVKRWREGR